MKKVTLFFKEFVAAAKGEDAEAMAINALIQADSALSSQIPSLKGDTVDLKMKVNEAKIHLDKSTVNYGQKITDRTSYIKALYEAENALTIANKALETHEKRIAFLEARLVHINTTVEIED